MLLAERRCCLLAISETGVQRSAQYGGALCCRQRWTVTQLKQLKDKVCTSSVKEKTGQCPLSIIHQKRRTDLVRTSDPRESGEATKAGHELEAPGQKRTRQTTDDLEPNHLTRPQRPAGHVIRGGRSCSTGPDQMEEETVRLMRHSAQEDISITISK